MSVSVAVVGTLNVDQVVRLPRFPGVGETVMGETVVERPGGKGANQAVAAASLCRTSLIGAVGDDEAGRRMVVARGEEGVNVEHVAVVDAPSGRAIIELVENGDNRIVVIAGANAELSSAGVTDSLDALTPDVVLTQLETTREVTEACARWALEHGRRFVLNPSPVAPLDEEILRAADPLVVNESEASYYRSMIGVPASVVITLGADGVAVRDGDGEHRLAVRAVTTADTVGAGDCFTGTLAALLARGDTVLDAARQAADAATDYVAAQGAR